jgi:hypothetical protein
MTNTLSSLDTNAILNRLQVLHHRSLPVYLNQAMPWLHRNSAAAQEALHVIAADHQATADRFGEMIVAEGGVPTHGEFPLRYTALHDLALDYLVVRMIEYEKLLIQRISECADLLRMAPAAQAAALESLGAAKAHLQSLEEVAPNLHVL